MAFGTGLYTRSVLKASRICLSFILITGVCFGSQINTRHIQIMRIDEAQIFALIIRSGRTDFLIQRSINSGFHALMARPARGIRRFGCDFFPGRKDHRSCVLDYFIVTCRTIYNRSHFGRFIHRHGGCSIGSEIILHSRRRMAFSTGNGYFTFFIPMSECYGR